MGERQDRDLDAALASLVDDNTLARGLSPFPTVGAAVGGEPGGPGALPSSSALPSTPRGGAGRAGAVGATPPSRGVEISQSRPRGGGGGGGGAQQTHTVQTTTPRKTMVAKITKTSENVTVEKPGQPKLVMRSLSDAAKVLAYEAAVRFETEERHRREIAFKEELLQGA